MSHQHLKAPGVRFAAAGVIAVMLGGTAAGDEGPDGPRFVGFGGPVDLGVSGPPIDVDAGDVNNDGIVDVLAASASGFGTTVRVWLGTPDGEFVAQSSQVGAPADTTAIRLGDFDADGNLDLAIADGAGSVAFRWGVGDGSFLAGGSSAVPIGGGAVDVDAGFADGDAAADVFVAGADGTLTLIPGSENRSMGDPATVTLGGTPVSIAAGDLDGDGDHDVVVGLADAGVVRLVRTSGLTLELAGSVSGVGTPVAVAAGDLSDPPDRADVAAVTEEGMLLAWSSTGDFGLTPLLETPVGAEPSAVRIADLDEDGDGDVLVADAGPAEQVARIRVLVQDPGGFAEPMEIEETERLVDVVLVDLDGNTSLDFVGLVDDEEFRLVRTRINVTDVLPPGPFELAFPADGQTGLPRPEDLVWEGATARLRWTEAAGFTVTYRVRIADNPELIDPVVDLDGIEEVVWDVPPGTLSSSFTWYWSVEACTAAGITMGSPTVAQFTMTCREDLDGDGSTGLPDLLALLASLGPR